MYHEAADEGDHLVVVLVHMGRMQGGVVLVQKNVGSFAAGTEYTWAITKKSDDSIPGFMTAANNEVTIIAASIPGSSAEGMYKLTATGQGRYSGEVTKEFELDLPADALPGAPAITSITPEDSKLVVNWSAPADTGYYDAGVGEISGYTVYWDTSSGVSKSSTDKQTVQAPATSLEVSSLSNNQIYHVIVTATTDAGEGDASTAVSGTPVPDDALPGAPTITSIAPRDGKLLVSWNAPVNKGIYNGVEGYISGYTVYWGTNSGLTTSTATDSEPAAAGTTSHEIDGLTNGQIYYVIVTATTGAGEGNASTEDSGTPVPADAPPGAPTAVTATAGDGKVTLAWTAPTNTGYTGGDGTVGVITKYTVYYHTATFDDTNLPTTNVDTADGTTTTADVPGLTGGTQYFFRVTATNTTGPSVLSDEVSTHANASPGALDFGIDVFGDKQITLKWAAPAEKGYINSDGTVGIITAYTVYYHTATFDGTNLPTTTVEVSDGNAASVNVTGLINDTPYFFGITATNATGEGALSNVKTGTPVRGDEPPGRPTNLKAVAGDKQVTVSWTAPTDPGYVSGAEGTISEYIVYYHTAGFDTTSLPGTTAVTDGTTTSVVVTGLTNGQQYYFKIIVVNNGYIKSLLSEEVTATPN